MNNQLHMKNRETGKLETIAQHDLKTEPWGIVFTVDTELEAYKAAYLYRYCRHGTEVKLTGGSNRWMVTVFNSFAKSAGITK